MNKPNFFFESYAQPGIGDALGGNAWFVRSEDGRALGIVEQAGRDRFSAYRNGKFYGPFKNRRAAGDKLEEVAAQEAGA